MFKRIVHAFAVGVGLTGTAPADLHFTIDGADVTAPNGWREVVKEDGRIGLRSPDDRQQATISVMRFGADASFADFKRLCSLRIEAEKKELGSGFIEPTAPYERDGRFGMMFYGGREEGRQNLCGPSFAREKSVDYDLPRRKRCGSEAAYGVVRDLFDGTKAQMKKQAQQSGPENPIPSGTADAKASGAPDSRGL